MSRARTVDVSFILLHIEMMKDTSTVRRYAGMMQAQNQRFAMLAMASMAMPLY